MGTAAGRARSGPQDGGDAGQQARTDSGCCSLTVRGLIARRVIVAAGIKPFANRPAYAEGLPSELASHTGDHQDLGRFSGARVLVVGGGQSALESAALLTRVGAEAEVVVRADHLNWLHGGKYHRKLGRLAPLLYAPTDVGPMGLSRLVAVPDLFRRLPAPDSGSARLPVYPPGWRRLADPPAAGRADHPGPVHRVGRAQRAMGSRSRSPTAGSEPSTTSCWAPVTGSTSAATRSWHRAARRGYAGSAATRARARNGIVRPGTALRRRPGRVELRADHALRVGRLVHRPRAGPGGSRRPPGRPDSGRGQPRWPRQVTVSDPHEPSGRACRTRRPTSGEQIGGVVLGGDSQGLGIARSLGRHGIPVCVIDDETSISRASRFVQHSVRVHDLRTRVVAARRPGGGAEQVRAVRMGPVPHQGRERRGPGGEPGRARARFPGAHTGPGLDPAMSGTSGRPTGSRSSCRSRYRGPGSRNRKPTWRPST